MITLARVTAVHPETGTIDCVCINTRRRFAGVRVAQVGASTDTGRIDLPVPGLGANSSASDPALMPLGAREVVAVIAFFGGQALCLGFLPPRTSQMYFEAGRRIDRHGSDVYSSIDSAGNTEWRHPSGSMVRFSESAVPEDLTGQDADGAWAITRNTDRAPRLHVRLANAGVTKFEMTVDPAGNVTMTTAGNISMSTPGDMAIDAANLTINADIATTGTLTNNGVNVSSTHVHGGVQSGGSNTSTPQ
ncbi:hypothetical protein [Methylocaldum sp.]|uniref:hypothetical protein n=1 Tax=Methylocaldum sp. TaxID=1969727 RepID=UPI002D4A643B|nr:hypothetical protein [Methylocaldum sp.]HYE36125.1 hypothetical protein [Methylocaldum sp.]